MANAPKNIVLLSDGTGNSSAKLMKTNVWRMYEAVDLTTGQQLACYDNGVGTSSFKPFAVLGGGLGWGLKRNVRRLYTFACTHYVPGGDGRLPDQLFGFGFSRGAFTMRVLMGLIESQGLITGARGYELDRLAKWAYREYRKQFNATKGLVTPLRWFRDITLRTWEAIRGKTPYAQAKRIHPEVAFVGLWDTVDAYGLPIDEMTRGWDKWVWPLSMCERTAPRKIAKLCHAVALDDERHTFHPVLLDERNAPAVDHTDKERVTQVWFSGVHSNVGGGYPDDSLAHVSLLWMADEAAKKNLRLHSHIRSLWVARADPNGPMYDSRGGVGAYYRYNPRSIQKLTDDHFADVVIERPKIHESVFHRIQSERDDYAPICLPERYDVVTAAPKRVDQITEQGTLCRGTENPFEHPTQARARCANQERVWNLVWFRRVLYFSTIAVTVILLLAPAVLKEEPLGELDVDSGTVRGLLDLAGAFVPDMAKPIITFWQSHSAIFAALAIALAALLFLSTVVQRSIRDRMKRLWDGIAIGHPRAVGAADGPNDVIYRFRSSAAYRHTAEFLSQKAFPAMFGLVALAAVAIVVVGTLNRATFTLASTAGRTCVPGRRAEPTGNTWAPIKFDNRQLCQTTGIELLPGHTYELSITLPDGWKDASIPSGLTGVSTAEKPWVYIPALPFRRVLRAPWFVPVARIGVRTPEYHVLTQTVTEITPRRKGQLFLFMNDAVGVPPFRTYFYDNNEPGPASPATLIVRERTTATASAATSSAQ
jgi:uncharacterized protein (DUF2235 family)